MSKNFQFQVNQLVASKRVKHAAIISLHDGAVWGTSTDPIFDIFKDHDEVKALFSNSPDDMPGEFTVAGEEYSLRRATVKSIQGDKVGGGGGCCLIRTRYGHAIIVGVYDGSMDWSAAMAAVEDLAFHLQSQGL